MENLPTELSWEDPREDFIPRQTNPNCSGCRISKRGGNRTTSEIGQFPGDEGQKLAKYLTDRYHRYTKEEIVCPFSISDYLMTSTTRLNNIEI